MRTPRGQEDGFATAIIVHARSGRRRPPTTGLDFGAAMLAAGQAVLPTTWRQVRPMPILPWRLGSSSMARSSK